MPPYIFKQAVMSLTQEQYDAFYTYISKRKILHMLKNQDEVIALTDRFHELVGNPHLSLPMLSYVNQEGVPFTVRSLGSIRGKH